MVGERADRVGDRRFLPAALGGGADEDAGVLAPVAARLPLCARVVPEGFPLRGEVAVAGGDAEEEAVWKEKVIIRMV